ncbi:MAG: hypothetical protein HY815_12870 [Candidatus Riflebacteria bacterium]|nr:hypothetical protein [Candidatus Riflebacteria bacterium]
MRDHPVELALLADQRLVEYYRERLTHHDMSHRAVVGAFILDMVAHNNDRERNVFQIAPGFGARAAGLAVRAHEVNEHWNASVAVWNVAPERKDAPPCRRIEKGTELPAVAPHLALAGEIRPWWHFGSSLYNADAMIFSDAGIPVVLFRYD